MFHHHSWWLKKILIHAGKVWVVLHLPQCLMFVLSQVVALKTNKKCSDIWKISRSLYHYQMVMMLPWTKLSITANVTQEPLIIIWLSLNIFKLDLKQDPWTFQKTEDQESSFKNLVSKRQSYILMALYFVCKYINLWLYSAKSRCPETQSWMREQWPFKECLTKRSSFTG